MMTDRIVDDYLKQLSDELQDLPPARRHELLNEITEHIHDAMAEGDGGEAGVRNVLERLGDPADIAEEARERFGITKAKPSPLDWAAVFLLPIGGIVIPVIGWIVGVVFLWSSRVWTTKEKVIGTLVVPGGLLLPVGLLILPTRVCVSSPAGGQFAPSTCGASNAFLTILGILASILVLVAPILSAGYLASRLRARTA